MIPTFIHRFALAIIFLVWTWLLLKPNPVPEFMAHSLMEDVKFFISKVVHFSAFAFLGWYGTFRVETANWKWIWLALVAYAGLTELGQYYGNLWYQTNRHGCTADVLIDSAGVLLSAIVRRKF
jgi:hypothetical protein